MNRIGLLGLIYFGLTLSVSAQIMNQDDAVEAPAAPQGNGAIVPLLKVGVQSVQALGYNLETGASGFGYETSNPNAQLNTLAFFDILFVDSRESQPLYYESGADPSVWSAHFKIRNFTARLNVGNEPSGLELLKPSWIAEVQGQGFRFGMFTQGGSEIGTDGSNNNPVARLTGANEVLNVGANADAGAADYVLNSQPSPNSVAFYGAAKNNSGILYAGYGMPGLFQAYVSALAQGSVNSDPEEDEQGWAWALDAEATPLGDASASQPLALTLRADAIKGFGFKKNTTNYVSGTPANLADGDTAGVGLSAKVDYWLAQDLIVSPLVAYDARLNDRLSTLHPQDVESEVGAGVMLTLSPKKFVADEYNELSTIAAAFQNNRIQKFAYVQLMGASSQATDTDLVLKLEEPDGAVGLDSNLGAMLEYRVNDVAKTQPDALTSWSLTGRVSYDLFDHSVVPYARWYANGQEWLTLDEATEIKFRIGVQIAVLPGFGIEATYLTPQLYDQGTTRKDAGKLELIAAFKSESGEKTLTPKTMTFNDWKD